MYCLRNILAKIKIVDIADSESSYEEDRRTTIVLAVIQISVLI